jgi:hypothetical protein
MKRRSFEATTYLGWEKCARARHTYLPPREQNLVESQQHSTKRKRCREPSDNDTFLAPPKRQNMGLAAAAPVGPRTVTIPETVVSNILTERQQLLNQVSHLEGVIQGLRSYIAQHCVGEQRDYNAALVCVES